MVHPAESLRLRDQFFVTLISNTGSSIALEQTDFDIGRTTALVCFTSVYMIRQALGGLVFPPIAESFGGRTVYVTTTFGYAIFCLIIAAWPILPVVVIGRFGSGFLSAMPAVAAAGSIENMWDVRARIWLIHLWIATAVLGLALGPVARLGSTHDMPRRHHALQPLCSPFRHRTTVAHSPQHILLTRSRNSGSQQRQWHRRLSASRQRFNPIEPREGNKDLYHAIENVITASLPLWIETLLSTQFLATQRIKHDFGDGRIEKPRSVRRDRANIDQDEAGEQNDDEGSDEDEAHYDDWHNSYDAAIPEPKTYTLRQRVRPEVFAPDDSNSWRLSDIDQPLRNPAIDPTEEQIAEGQEAMQEERERLQNVFKKQGMQVIVKLANVHLTPEKPTYDGGSWHIEGQLNEHIAASALYYYDSSNITDSYLAFREGVDKDELNDYEQSEYYALMEIYGIKNDWGDAIQVLGMTTTREDRLLVFPNVLQHRVSPFELKDKTKPGHRKLLALFLVDPFIRIPSTSNVPPQQREWWARAMEEKGTLTHKLPMELVDQIIDEVEDFPITLEEAKELREQLIEERKIYVNDSMHAFKENGYCFCEH